MITPYTVILLVSGLLFLATAGYLVGNAGSVALLFGKRRSQAEPGDTVIDPHSRGHGASPTAIKTAIGLHVLGLVGLVLGAFIMSVDLLDDHPDVGPLPKEMNPVPTPPPT